MEKWRGKTAIVTGAALGIGAAITKDLVANGINVIGLDILADKMEDLKNELKDAPGKVTAIGCDVSNRASVEAAFKLIESSLMTVQILVNNAGIVRDVDILDDEDDSTAMDKMEAVINTNWIGLVHVTRKAYHMMEKSGDYGIIINIGSVSSHSVPSWYFKFNTYAGTKHALKATTEVIRQELVKKNNKKVRISDISPGLVKTDILVNGGFIKLSESGDTWLAKQGMTALKDTDIAEAVRFLLTTDYSVNLTEIVIKVTGEKF